MSHRFLVEMILSTRILRTGADSPHYLKTPAGTSCGSLLTLGLEVKRADPNIMSYTIETLQCIRFGVLMQFNVS